jgi:hypothetical protein
MLMLNPDLNPTDENYVTDISNKFFLHYNHTLTDFDDVNADGVPEFFQYPAINLKTPDSVDGIDVGLTVTLGEDGEGNLYMASYLAGRIYRMLTTNPDPDSIDIGVPGTRGDFNSDGLVDVRDIDLLAMASRPGARPPLGIYDLNGNGTVEFDPSPSDTTTPTDSDILVRELVYNFDTNGVPLVDTEGEIIRGTEYGDLDLDGDVFLGDLDKLISNYREAGIFSWADGNINGSFQEGTLAAPRITLGDLDVLISHYRFGVGSGGLVSNVPEPATSLLLLTGICLFLTEKRDKRRARGIR